MKFEINSNKMVKNHQQIFRKDPYTHACTRGKNVRAHVSSRQNARAHVFASCARVRERIFTKTLLMISHYLIDINLKFHKDRSFRCGDICKTILSFENHQFFNVFSIFSQFHTSKVFQSGKLLNGDRIFWKLDIKMDQCNE